MGYYIRVLGTNPAAIPAEHLRAAASPGVIDLNVGDDHQWQQLLLKHASGQEIAIIERNAVVAGELGGEELQEFIDEVPFYEPTSAAVWLGSYLPKVNVIYAFQLLGGTDLDDGWTLLHRVYNAVWSFTGGILQADGEGFSNEEGYTILWQFPESAQGAWNVGVLLDGSRWAHFEMDLGSLEHREAFRRGQVPPGARLLT
jgi:hypothetical protein